MRRRNYRVIVIGGGHAGAEAAWAAANLLSRSEGEGASVALVTLRRETIGVMSCNPAIGGLAKGQLVREIDAMGGLMGLAADATGIHFKMLNTSKGPAVRGPRCQNDKHLYAEAVQRLIGSRDEIDVIEGAVESFVIEGDRAAGVRVRGDGVEMELRAGAVVLTTGTFMRGLMHTGDERTEGGRAGEAPANAISASVVALGFELGRLKTGTPARVLKGSIEWEGLEAQPGDDEPVAFSDLTGWGEGVVGSLGLEQFPAVEQVECRRTATTAAAHEAIRANLHRAPLYSGVIESAGPRYCPSIEDKVVRFADRESHGVFLEPESLRTDWVYCNGISSSLPEDVQDVIVRTMPGCERAEIAQYGYAVEYDMVRPHQIFATGETKRVSGLFLAGQINGTSGYEEAGAQGLIAGINAARLARGEAADFVLGRDQAYIGVLMDDLVTKTPVEPYRMFTSRAEHRLLLRADNSADRLTPVAESLGLLGDEIGRERVRRYRVRREEMAAIDRGIDAGSVDGVPLSKVVRRAEFVEGDLRAALPCVRAGDGAWFTALAERKYEAYVVRAKAEIRRAAEMERKRLPAAMDYAVIEGLRAEAKAALSKYRPASFGQAGRLEGVTPADLTLLSVHLARGVRKAGVRGG